MILEFGRAFSLELKVFLTKNVPYPGQLNDQSTRKKIFRGTIKASGGGGGGGGGGKKYLTFFKTFLGHGNNFVGLPKHFSGGIKW